jgi:hypothetical protein
MAFRRFRVTKILPFDLPLVKICNLKLNAYFSVMKKAVFGSYIILSLIFVSCEKKQTWYCECGPVGTSTVTYTTTITKATKSNASDLCNKAAGNKMPSGSYACQVSPQ